MATAHTSIDQLESREADALTHLEERIQKTVALVTRLRAEKEAASDEVAAARSELALAHSANTKLSEELTALRAEKLEVRARLEKLLGHIDQLGAV
jgi:chromosome segregation ATPase